MLSLRGLQMDFKSKWGKVQEEDYRGDAKRIQQK